MGVCMTLVKQIVSYKLYGGLQTKADEKLVQQPAVSRLQDAVFDTTGAVKKRHGYEALSTDIQGGGVISDVTMLESHEGQLLCRSGSTLYSYAEQQQEWVPVGTLIGAQSERLLVENTNGAPTSFSQTCVLNGIIAKVYTRYPGGLAGGGLYLDVSDVGTGTYYQKTVQLGSYAGELASIYNIPSQNAIYVVYQSGLHQLSCAKILTTSPQSLSSPVVIASDFEADNFGGSAMSVYPSDTYGVIAYFTTANTLKVFRISATPSVVSGTVTISEDAPRCWVYVSGGVAYVAYQSFSVSSGGIDGGLRLCAISISSMSYVFSPLTVRFMLRAYKAIMFVSGSSINVYFGDVDITNQVSNNTYRVAYNLSGTLLTSPAIFHRRLLPYSEFFYFNGRYCAYFYYAGHTVVETSTQSELFLIDSNNNVLSKEGLATLGSSAAFYNYAVKKTSSYQNKYYLSVEKDTVSGTTSSTLVAEVEPNKTHKAKHGKTLYFANGLVRAYDGNSVYDHGFYLYPEGVALFGVHTGSGSVSAGTYQYKVFFDFYNGNDELVRSSVSLSFSKTITSSYDAVSIIIPTESFYSRNCYPRIYRTTNNGTIFYALALNENYFLNDNSNSVMSFIDEQSDASLVSGELLYTSGGVLENNAPPPSDIIVSAKRRLWVVSNEDNNIYYSKEQADGYAAEFSLFLYVKSTSAYGKPRALASLDEKVIIFYENAIEYIYGDGPSDTGVDGVFSQPILITTKVGCSLQETVLSTDEGVFFKSQSGIYLLDRSLNISYVGAQVEAYNNVEINSVDIIPGTTQIRFLSNQYTLLYDYFTKTWGVFTGVLGTDAVSHRGVYHHYSIITQAVLRETQLYNDPLSSIPFLVSTPWITLSAIRGFQRVWRIIVTGDTQGEKSIRIRVYYDYETLHRSTYDIAVTGGALRAGVRLDIQKCEAIKIELSETPPGYPQSVTFTSIELEIGAKNTLSRMPLDHGSV